MSGAKEYWAAAIDGCKRDLALCPGVLVASLILRAESPADAIETLRRCPCPEARRLEAEPHSYRAGVEAGIACRHVARRGGCGAPAIRSLSLPEGVPAPPRETMEHAAQALRAADRAGYRVADIQWDGELVHIIVHAGCGVARITCSPVTCAVTGGEGVEAELSSDMEKLVVRCARAPPYLNVDHIHYGTEEH